MRAVNFYIFSLVAIIITARALLLSSCAHFWYEANLSWEFVFLSLNHLVLMATGLGDLTGERCTERRSRHKRKGEPDGVVKIKALLLLSFWFSGEDN